MSWYKISFSRSEASTMIADLAQDFLDTLQGSECHDGIALFRQKQHNGDDVIVYYVSLNTLRPSPRLEEVYHAVRSEPPEPNTVDWFGGDASVLGPEMA